VSVRQLEDGIGVLGLRHDRSTISRIERLVRGEGRRLQVARGPDGIAPTVDELDDDASPDACRADASAHGCSRRPRPTVLSRGASSLGTSRCRSSWTWRPCTA